MVLQVLEYERLESLRRAKKVPMKRRRHETTTATASIDADATAGATGKRHGVVSSETQRTVSRRSRDVLSGLQAATFNDDNDEDQENRRHAANHVDSPINATDGDVSSRTVNDDASVMIEYSSTTMADHDDQLLLVDAGGAGAIAVDPRMQRLLELEEKARRLSELVSVMKERRTTANSRSHSRPLSGLQYSESDSELALANMAVTSVEEEQNGSEDDVTDQQTGPYTRATDDDSDHEASELIVDDDNEQSATAAAVDVGDDSVEEQDPPSVEEVRRATRVPLRVTTAQLGVMSSDEANELHPSFIGVQSINVEWPGQQSDFREGNDSNEDEAHAGTRQLSLRRSPVSSSASSSSSIRRTQRRNMDASPSPSSSSSSGHGDSQSSDGSSRSRDAFDASLHSYMQQRQFSDGKHSMQARTHQHHTANSTVRVYRAELAADSASYVRREAATTWTTTDASEAFLKLVREADDSLSVINSAAKKIWLAQQRRLSTQAELKRQREQDAARQEQIRKDQQLRDVMQTLTRRQERAESDDNSDASLSSASIDNGSDESKRSRPRRQFARLEDIIQEIKDERRLEKHAAESDATESAPSVFWNDMLATSATTPVAPLQTPGVVIDRSELERQQMLAEMNDDGARYRADHSEADDTDRRVRSPRTLARMLLAEVAYHEAIHDAHLQLSVMEQAHVVEQAQSEAVTIATAFKEEMESNFTSHQLALDHAMLTAKFDADLRDVMTELEAVERGQTKETAAATAAMDQQVRQAKQRDSAAQTDELARADATTNATLVVEFGTATGPRVSDTGVQCERQLLSPSPSPSPVTSADSDVPPAAPSVSTDIVDESRAFRSVIIPGKDPLAAAYYADLETRRRSDESLLQLQLQVLTQKLDRELVAIDDAERRGGCAAPEARLRKEAIKMAFVSEKANLERLRAASMVRYYNDLLAFQAIVSDVVEPPSLSLPTLQTQALRSEVASSIPAHSVVAVRAHDTTTAAVERRSASSDHDDEYNDDFDVGSAETATESGARDSDRLEAIESKHAAESDGNDELESSNDDEIDQDDDAATSDAVGESVNAVDSDAEVLDDEYDDEFASVSKSSAPTAPETGVADDDSIDDNGFEATSVASETPGSAASVASEDAYDASTDDEATANESIADVAVAAAEESAYDDEFASMSEADSGALAIVADTDEVDPISDENDVIDEAQEDEDASCSVREDGSDEYDDDFADASEGDVRRSLQHLDDTGDTGDDGASAVGSVSDGKENDRVIKSDRDVDAEEPLPDDVRDASEVDGDDDNAVSDDAASDASVDDYEDEFASVSASDHPTTLNPHAAVGDAEERKAERDSDDVVRRSSASDDDAYDDDFASEHERVHATSDASAVPALAVHSSGLKAEQSSSSEDSSTTKLLLEHTVRVHEQVAACTEATIERAEGKLARKKSLATELLHAKQRLLQLEQDKFRLDEETRQVNALAQLAIQIDVNAALSNAQPHITQTLAQEMALVQQSIPSFVRVYDTVRLGQPSDSKGPTRVMAPSHIAAAGPPLPQTVTENATVSPVAGEEEYEAESFEKEQSTGDDDKQSSDGDYEGDEYDVRERESVTSVTVKKADEVGVGRSEAEDAIASVGDDESAAQEELDDGVESDIQSEAAVDDEAPGAAVESVSSDDGADDGGSIAASVAASTDEYADESFDDDKPVSAVTTSDNGDDSPGSNHGVAAFKTDEVESTGAYDDADAYSDEDFEENASETSEILPPSNDPVNRRISVDPDHDTVEPQRLDSVADVSVEQLTAALAVVVSQLALPTTELADTLCHYREDGVADATVTVATTVVLTEASGVFAANTDADAASRANDKEEEEVLSKSIEEQMQRLEELRQRILARKSEILSVQKHLRVEKRKEELAEEEKALWDEMERVGTRLRLDVAALGLSRQRNRLERVRLEAKHAEFAVPGTTSPYSTDRFGLLEGYDYVEDAQIPHTDTVETSTQVESAARKTIWGATSDGASQTDRAVFAAVERDIDLLAGYAHIEDTESPSATASAPTSRSMEDDSAVIVSVVRPTAIAAYQDDSGAATRDEHVVDLLADYAYVEDAEPITRVSAGESGADATLGATAGIAAASLDLLAGYDHVEDAVLDEAPLTADEAIDDDESEDERGDDNGSEPPIRSEPVLETERDLTRAECVELSGDGASQEQQAVDGNPDQQQPSWSSRLDTTRPMSSLRAKDVATVGTPAEALNLAEVADVGDPDDAAAFRHTEFESPAPCESKQTVLGLSYEARDDDLADTVFNTLFEEALADALALHARRRLMRAEELSVRLKRGLGGSSGEPIASRVDEVSVSTPSDDVVGPSSVAGDTRKKKSDEQVATTDLVATGNWLTDALYDELLDDAVRTGLALQSVRHTEHSTATESRARRGGTSVPKPQLDADSSVAATVAPQAQASVALHEPSRSRDSTVSVERSFVCAVASQLCIAHDDSTGVHVVRLPAFHDVASRHERVRAPHVLFSVVQQTAERVLSLISRRPEVYPVAVTAADEELEPLLRQEVEAELDRILAIRSASDDELRRLAQQLAGEFQDSGSSSSCVSLAELQALQTQLVTSVTLVSERMHRRLLLPEVAAAPDRRTPRASSGSQPLPLTFMPHTPTPTSRRRPALVRSALSYATAQLEDRITDSILDDLLHSELL